MIVKREKSDTRYACLGPKTPPYGAGPPGIESTLSQGVRRLGLRESRFIGLKKTSLQNVLIGAAINFIRLADWLGRGQTARRPRPHSKLNLLIQASAA
jgi:hypothetical protein